VLFSVIASWLLIGDVPAPVQAIGGALIITGVVLVRVDELRAPQPELAQPLPAGTTPAEISARSA
jgi:drug/metabolite transporter (DMT)-like permease